MSRYGGDGRYSAGNLAYREPPPNRWDADRLAHERDRRGGYYEDPYGGPPPQVEPPRRVRPVAPVYEDRRYYEDDRYGPRGTTVERRYFEEDDYYDPRTRNAQMVPYRPSVPEAPPRPGILRRQSSLDTFDRGPPRRYDEYERPRPRPQRVNMYVPEPPSPRGNRYRPPQREPVRDPRRDYREYDDIAIQDPDYYGDEGFREYREREWISSRRRDSPSPARSVRSKAPTEVAEEKVEEKEIVLEKKETKEEKPFPRRGKTKMPKRLVHTKVLFDLGYPYYEENEKTLVIEKALGPDNIDEIFAMSREYREKDVGTTKLLEAPPPAATTTKTTTTIEIPAVREPSPGPAESVHGARTADEITTKPLSEAPRSVREWDNLTTDSHHTHRSRRRSHSRHTRRSPSPDVKQIVIEKKIRVASRSPSPVRVRRRSRSRRSRSRRRIYDDDEEIIERRIIRENDDFDESNSINVGPLAFVRDRPRSAIEIEDEIELVRADRLVDRRERMYDRDDEILEIRRVESRSPSPRKEMYVERRGDNMVLKREKRSRSKSIPRPPSAREIRNMMYTLT